MRCHRTALFGGLTAGLLIANPLAAQTLEEICPGADEGTGALWGAVTDADAAMVLPGAKVTAVWAMEGQEQNAEAEVGLDGGYTMCYVPLETELAVTASFATMSSAEASITMTEMFTRHDLSLSMSGGGGAGEDDERIWACFHGGASTLNIQNSRIIRCDADWQPLEQCPREELGRVTARGTGAGSGVIREALENLSAEARRVGANAVINLVERDSLATGGSISGDAVLIELDPRDCEDDELAAFANAGTSGAWRSDPADRPKREVFLAY